ncbi:MAG: hypothetical protein V4735_05670 [Pseudomonadota bacterium]
MADIALPPALNTRLDALTGKSTGATNAQNREDAVNWKVDLEIKRALCSGDAEALQNQNKHAVKTLEGIANDPKGIDGIVAIFNDPKQKKMEEALVGTEGKSGIFSCASHQGDAGRPIAPRTATPASGIQH